MGSVRAILSAPPPASSRPLPRQDLSTGSLHDDPAPTSTPRSTLPFSSSSSRALSLSILFCTFRGAVVVVVVAAFGGELRSQLPLRQSNVVRHPRGPLAFPLRARGARGPSLRARGLALLYELKRPSSSSSSSSSSSFSSFSSSSSSSLSLSLSISGDRKGLLHVRIFSFSRRKKFDLVVRPQASAYGRCYVEGACSRS